MAASLWAFGEFVATYAGVEAGTALFTLTAGAVAVGTAYGLSRVVNGNQNKGPNSAQGSQGGRIQIPPATNNKIPIVYGNAFVNGIITDARLKSLGGENNDTMYYCIVLSETCNNASAAYTVDDIYWNDLRLVFDATNKQKAIEGRKNVDNPDGVTEDFIDTNFVVDGKSFVEVRVYAGSSAAADQIFPTTGAVPAWEMWGDNDGSWDADYKMSGLVFAIIKLTYGGEKGFTGLANMTFKLDNNINNPADVWYDYMTSKRYGAGIETSAIDTTPTTSAFAKWQAYCDDEITYTPIGGGSTTQKRYTINGIIDTSQQVKANIDSILQNGGAWMSYNVATGLWQPIPKRAATAGELAAALQFSDDNIISGITMGSTRLEDLYNKFEVEFYNKYNKDQKAYARLDLPAALRNANEPDNQLRMNLDLVNNSVQAELIGQLELRQSRDDIVIDFDSTFYGIQTQAGDVIAVTNSLYGWAPKYFRVMRVKEIESDDGNLTASIQAVEYNPDAYTVEPITEFTTIANIGIGNLVSSVGLPKPNDPTITDVRADASVPNFTFNVAIPSTGGPFDEIEIYFTEGWDPMSITGTVVAGTGSNGAPVGDGLLTVTAITYGALNVGDYFTMGLDNFVVTEQLTNNPVSKTFASGGAPGAFTVTLNNTTGLLIGNKLTGTGISPGAFITAIAGSQITLSKSFTIQAAGTYNVFGGLGTYVVDNPTPKTSTTTTLYDQPVDSDFVYLKKITPPGNASNFETGAIISTVITELPANTQTYRRYFLKARLGVKKNFGTFTNNSTVDLDGNVKWSPNPVAAGKLTDLSDVLITSPVEGETLYYDSATNQWKNNGILKINDSTTGVEIYNTAGTRVRRTETTTNTTITSLTVSGATTGTTAAGFGTSIAIENEISPNNYTVGAYITSLITDVTSGSEDADLLFTIQSAGTTSTPLRLTGNDIVVGGDLTVTGNDIKSSSATAITLSGANVSVAGDLTVTGTNINTGATGNIIQIDRTTTGTTVAARALILQSTSTGTPTVGFGTGLEFSAQTGVSNFERAGGINLTSTDITAGSEDFKMDFTLMTAGAVPDSKMSLSSAGNLTIDGELRAGDNVLLNFDQENVDAYLTAYKSTVSGSLYWDGTNWNTSSPFVVAGDLTVTGNDILSSSATAITLDGADVSVAGDLTVGGNDIKHSGGSIQITLATGGVVFAGDIQVNGNDIKSSGGATAITLSGANVSVAGDLTVTGTNINTGATDTIIEIDRTSTATADPARALILQSTSTGTPAVGFGTALEFSAQTGVSNFERAGIIQVRSTDITSGSEDFAMDFALMQNGSTYTNKLSILSDGNLVVVPGYNNTTTPIGIQGPIAASDFWFVGGYDPSGTGSNNGAMVIASGNNGNEPIYVRQYTGSSVTQPFPGTNTVAREATLLDANGNTTIPGSLTFNNSTMTTYTTTSTSTTPFNILGTSARSMRIFAVAEDLVNGEVFSQDVCLLKLTSSTGTYNTNNSAYTSFPPVATFTVSVISNVLYLTVTPKTSNSTKFTFVYFQIG